MRILFGLVAVSMLLMATQPALAVCVNRGGVIACTQDKQAKYAHFIKEEDFAVEKPTKVGQSELPPSAASGASAWVLTPQAANGATILDIPDTASACAAAEGC